MPTMDTNMRTCNETQSADEKWVDEELIPFLNVAYGPHPPGYWTKVVGQITLQLPIHEVHEDFPSTIERFRLLLVNPKILTRAELKDFGHFRDCWNTFRICIGIFVRHNIYHGSDKLHSLGKKPDPDHPRLKDTTNVQETYIFGGKLQVKRIDPTKPVRPSAVRGDTIEPVPEFQWPLGQFSGGQSIPSSSSERAGPEVKLAPVFHRPSNLYNEPFRSEDLKATTARVEKWLHMLPRRPSHPPSEEVVREALRGIPFHAEKKLHPCPQNVLRRPASQINGPPRSHAGRPRRRNHQGNAPRNDHGAPSVDRPWGVVHAAMSSLMPLTPVSRVNLNLSCIYQVLAHPGSSYAVPHAQYPNFAQSPGTDGSYHGFHMRYPIPGYYGPSTHLHGGYQMQYAAPGNLAPVPQGYGSFYLPQAYLPVDQSSHAPFQVVPSVYEPGAHDNHLRMDANDFVQGANGHGV